MQVPSKKKTLHFFLWTRIDGYVNLSRANVESELKWKRENFPESLERKRKSSAIIVDDCFEMRRCCELLNHRKLLNCSMNKMKYEVLLKLKPCSISLDSAKAFL